MDRLGGSLSHLKSELNEKIYRYRYMTASEELKDEYFLIISCFVIFIKGILPDVVKYTLALDQLYLMHRRLLDLTHQGLLENSSQIHNDIKTMVEKELP